MSGVGLVVLYRATGVLNLAYGAIGALGAFISWSLINSTACRNGWPTSSCILFGGFATLCVRRRFSARRLGHATRSSRPAPRSASRDPDRHRCNGRGGADAAASRCRPSRWNYAARLAAGELDADHRRRLPDPRNRGHGHLPAPHQDGHRDAGAGERPGDHRHARRARAAGRGGGLVRLRHRVRDGGPASVEPGRSRHRRAHASS